MAWTTRLVASGARDLILPRRAPRRPSRPTRLQTVHIARSVRTHLHVSAPLESPWIWRGLLAVTVLVLAAFIWRAVRRRRAGVVASHRWPRRVGASAAVLVLVVVTALAWLNTYVGYLPTVSSLSNLATGGSPVPGSVPESELARDAGQIGPNDSAVVQIGVAAPRLHVPDLAAYVYLPPGYYAPDNARRRYPVVYLIHGFPGRPADWMLAGAVPQVMNQLLSDRQIGPMIIVAPNADGGWLHDSECLNQVGGPQLETYLTTTVVHYVDTHFRTLATRGARAVGGLSSGGYCALNLGLQHQAEFSTIIGFEPYGDPGHSAIDRLLAGSTALFRANSPGAYLPTMRFRYRMNAFLDAGGSSAGDIDRVRSLALELADRGQRVAFRMERDQSHTWKEALAGLPYALVFAAHHLLGGLATLPGHHRIVTVGRPRRGATDLFARRASAQRCRGGGCGP